MILALLLLCAVPVWAEEGLSGIRPVHNVDSGVELYNAKSALFDEPRQNAPPETIELPTPAAAQEATSPPPPPADSTSRLVRVAARRHVIAHFGVLSEDGEASFDRSIRAKVSSIALGSHWQTLDSEYSTFDHINARRTAEATITKQNAA